MVLNTSGFFFQLGRKLFWSALGLLSWAEEAGGGGGASARPTGVSESQDPQHPGHSNTKTIGPSV